MIRQNRAARLFFQMSVDDLAAEQCAKILVAESIPARRESPLGMGGRNRRHRSNAEMIWRLRGNWLLY
jgi:hypothetical protein